MTTIATIGFGEAAQAFVAGWRSEADASRIERLSTFDIKIEDPALRVSIVDNADRLSVHLCDQVRQAVEGADAVFSLVTADRALEAAEATSKFLAANAVYFDCNSCSPATKQKSASIVEGTGASYVDVAVMAPVYPARHRTPLLVSGPKAEEAVSFLTRLGMKASYAGADIGRASSIKMLRSVMVKGIEALTAECFLAARRARVDTDVIASLQASEPQVDWTGRGAYNLERMMVHGKRRAAEMR
ncbi:NAD(P)-dependent oxidoreductase [Rhizobium sp. Root708]|uniref:NAD(P)-dependent oxidoreductase n=1 Tax=Rhizobium sp. Root708 TaxID=1736592 RepID=UPI000AC414E1|nr:NAD(P)-dependent oxidoreductase [Rhizobium sp. Root708]